MRILVISDSHGNVRNIERAIENHPDTNVVIHLGDGADDITDLEIVYQNKQFYQVAGNCDWNCPLPITRELVVEQKHIFFTHGHDYHVKTGLDHIKLEARKRHADIVLFGHTHLPVTEYENGLYLLNPGSLQGTDGTYGVIEVIYGSIEMRILKI